MELTYEKIENGYLITGNNLRIKQMNMAPFTFPYPGATIEESAQNHIAAIIADNNAPQEPNELDTIKLALAELAEAQELEKLNTQLALAELAETMIGGAK